MATTTPVAKPTTIPAAPVVPITGRIIDSKAFMAILSKRVTLKTDHVGQQVVLAVQGNGQFLPKGFTYEGPMGKTENGFDRTIYNLVANSQLSMLRKENKLLLTEAMKAESVGDSETAHSLFNDYLNAVQLSFSVIENPGSTARKFEAGDQVKATVAEVLNGAGERQIVANDVRYKAPVLVAATKFELSDLIDLS